MFLAAAQVVDAATKAAEASDKAPSVVLWIIIVVLCIVVIALTKELRTANADARRPLLAEIEQLRKTLSDAEERHRAAFQGAIERHVHDVREYLPIIKDVLHRLLQSTEAIHGATTAFADVVDILRRTQRGLEGTRAELDDLIERTSNPGDTPPRGPATRKKGNER